MSLENLFSGGGFVAASDPVEAEETCPSVTAAATYGNDVEIEGDADFESDLAVLSAATATYDIPSCTVAPREFAGDYVAESQAEPPDPQDPWTIFDRIGKRQSRLKELAKLVQVAERALDDYERAPVFSFVAHDETAAGGFTRVEFDVAALCGSYGEQYAQHVAEQIFGPVKYFAQRQLSFLLTQTQGELQEAIDQLAAEPSAVTP
jgi:hypothetical protein